MKYLWNVIGWLTNWSWIVLLLVGIAGILLFSTNCENVMLKISVSLVTSAIFFVFVTDIHNRYKKHQNKRVINVFLFKIGESLRLCKYSIYPAFDLSNNTKGENKDEYVKDFENADFGDFWIRPKTRYQKFEEEKKNVKDLANYLQLFDTLSNTQQEVICEILSSVLVREEFKPIPSDLTETGKLSYSNNQKQMGECVFHLCEIMRKLK